MCKNDATAGKKNADMAPAPLPAAAVRALAEAEERRKNARPPNQKKEIGGRGGHDPIRYGDWEIKGRAIDF